MLFRSLRKAVDIEPDFALALGWLAHTITRRTHLYVFDRAERARCFEEAIAIARQGIALNPGNSVAYGALSRPLAVLGRFEEAVAAAETATSLNPNLAMAQGALGYVCAASGQPERALTALQRALRLNPIDPARTTVHVLISHALRALGDLVGSVHHARAASEASVDSYMPLVHLAASLALCDKLAEARTTAERARQLCPALSAAYMEALVEFHHHSTRDPLIDGLRRAGL